MAKRVVRGKVNNRDGTIFSNPRITQTIVNSKPNSMEYKAAFDLKFFQKRAKRIITEKVPPMPAHTILTMP